MSGLALHCLASTALIQVTKLLTYTLSLPPMVVTSLIYSMQARNLIKDSRLDKLVEADELIRMVHDGRSFAGWTEGHISFPPTFK